WIRDSKPRAVVSGTNEAYFHYRQGPPDRRPQRSVPSGRVFRATGTRVANRILHRATQCKIVPAGPVDQDPNQRARRVEPNASFSAASSRDGPTSRAVGAGPPRKFASTFPTSLRPNSM